MREEKHIGLERGDRTGFAGRGSGKNPLAQPKGKKIKLF